MSPLIKRSRKKDGQDLLGQVRRGKFGTQAEDVGIIMGPAKPGVLGGWTNRSSHPCMPVSSHGHADTGTANQHATIDAVITNFRRHGMGIVGVVAGISRVRPYIGDLNMVCLEEGAQLFFELIPGVVRPDGNGLD